MADFMYRKMYKLRRIGTICL